MPIRVCTCRCGSTRQRAQLFLQSVGYADWLNVPIAEGREESRKMLNYIPDFPEARLLDEYLSKVSKWVVIIGWNENGCRWSDIAHNANKSEIEAKLVVETFQ